MKSACSCFNFWCADGKETYTVTLLTTLRSDTGFHVTTPRSGNNCSVDFLEDIIEFLDRGCLRKGDYLVSCSHRLRAAER